MSAVSEARERLLESMMTVNKIGRQLAAYHLARMSDQDVEAELERRRKPQERALHVVA